MANFFGQKISTFQEPYETSVSNIFQKRPISSVVSLWTLPTASAVLGDIGNHLSAFVSKDDRTLADRVQQNVAPVAQRTAEGLGQAAGTVSKVVPKTPVPAVAPALGAGMPTPPPGGIVLDSLNTPLRESGPQPAVARQQTLKKRKPAPAVAVAPAAAPAVESSALGQTVPDTSLYPQVPGLPASSPLWQDVAGEQGLKEIAGGMTPDTIARTTLPSGSGIATMGDKTVMLRGGNSVPAAENAQVIAQREQPAAPQKTLVGSGTSAPRLVGPGEEALAPDYGRMSLGEIFAENLRRRGQLADARLANVQSEIASRATGDQLKVAAFPGEEALRRAQAGHYTTTDQVALGLLPYQQQKSAAETAKSQADTVETLGMLPVKQRYYGGLADNAQATAAATRYANSPEGMAAAAQGEKAKGDAKGRETQIKHWQEVITKHDLPEEWRGKELELAKRYAANDDPNLDYKLIFSPGQKGRQGIGVSQAAYQKFQDRVQQYTAQGYPEKDAYAMVFGEFQQSKVPFENVPDLRALYLRPDKPPKADPFALAGE